uniref:Uncharacterized protein n=1 Tax=Salvator merianae TaxID=96440 RepID=A0A8D0C1E4_SALMN
MATTVQESLSSPTLCYPENPYCNRSTSQGCCEIKREGKTIIMDFLPQPKSNSRLDRKITGEPMNFLLITFIRIMELAYSIQSQEQMNSKVGYNNDNSRHTCLKERMKS